jgi:glycosyltransferase involved in cell wall biosynthesis
MPKVSVIIPTYNCAQYISDTISSVLNQTHTEFEIIVIDDGSIDNTRMIVGSFHDDRLQYYYKENGGSSNARNYGIAKATGEYIAFLDSDDVWLPAKLEDQINLFKRDHNLEIVSCNIQFINEVGKDMHLLDMRTLYPKDGLNLENLLQHSSLLPSSVLIKKEVIDEIGSFEGQYDPAEDIEYFLRVLARYSLGIVEKVLLKYRVRPHSWSRGLRSYHARERVLDDFFKSPTVNNDIELESAKTNAYYGLYYNHGKDLLWYGKIKEARQYFIKALRYKWTIDVFYLYVKSFIKEALMFLGFLKISAV